MFTVQILNVQNYQFLENVTIPVHWSKTLDQEKKWEKKILKPGNKIMDLALLEDVYLGLFLSNSKSTYNR